MTSKTSVQAIVDAIKSDFHTYLRKGVRIDSVVGDAHPDLDISDIQSLLRVHFLLTEASVEGRPVGVIDFVKRLPDEIRRLKTTTRGHRVDVRGQIRGHVDWQESLKRKSRTGQLDEPIFVCLQREEDYDINENLVLKRLLTVIRNILEEDLESVLTDPEGYKWLGYWTDSRSDSNRSELPHEQLTRMYRENIYLQRISVDQGDVTDRIIEAVKRSRSSLYREAAELLDLYRRLMRHQLSDEEARDVLNNTMIAPRAEDTLFELYWIFRLLNTFDGVTFNVIKDRSRPVIGSWEVGDSRFTLYHDSTGEHLTFREEVPNQTIEDDGYLLRLQRVHKEWDELTSRLLGRTGEGSLWGGRPDILLEKTRVTDDGEEVLEQVFIGEVKYTSDQAYAAAGLRELLEYMAFVRRESDHQYVEDKDSILSSSSVHGLLFVDHLSVESDSESEIDIVQFGEELPALIGEI